MEFEWAMKGAPYPKLFNTLKPAWNGEIQKRALRNKEAKRSSSYIEP